VNFFKLYMGDYQRDTGALSIAEHGAYFLMLQYHYATEKPLPIGKDLYRLIRCASKAERDAVDTVSKLYWIETSDGLINARAQKEMAEAHAYADAQSKRANKRWDKRLDIPAHMPAHMPAQCPVDASHSHSHNHSKSKVKSRTSAQSAKAPLSLRLGEGQVLETIPLVGDAVAEVCETHLQELERLYPGVDPLPTLREIRGWNLSNPNRRKTPRGIAAHINAWFQRDQNRG